MARTLTDYALAAQMRHIGMRGTLQWLLPWRRDERRQAHREWRDAMLMSDEEYFRSCVARERQLAHLLGHKVEEFYEDAGTLWDGPVAMPKWTRDWAACGPLIAEYEIDIRYDREPGAEHAHCVHAGPVSVHLADYPDRQHAVMYAVVKAVISLLEHRRHRHH